MYSVSEIAQELNIPKKTVYRIIDKMTDSEKQEYLSSEKGSNGRTIIKFTQNGFYYVLDLVDKEFVSNCDKNDDNNISVITALDSQIKSLNGFIEVLQAEIQQKDNIISSLLEQNKNFQVLLQSQQYISLPEKKRNLLHRLFSRGDDNI